jgi:hypothetical protein
MRILLSCLQSLKRHPIPAYDFWRHYFTKGCEEASISFVEVPGVDWAEALLYRPGKELENWRDRTWQTVLAFVRREQANNPLDFFLCYLYPEQVEVAAISELQRIGIPCVNFFCDNVRQFRRVPIEYQLFALHWVPEFEALPLYRKAGLPHIHAPMPCWVPKELRNVPDTETEPPTFIGSADVLRSALLSESLHGGADFVVRGPGWASINSPSNQEPPQKQSLERIARNQLTMLNQHGFKSLYYKVWNRIFPVRTFPVLPQRIRPAVFGGEYIRVTREAQVTIGVNRVPTARSSLHSPLTYSRLRDLEAPMSGACYLTEWTEGLSQLYDIGTEIETYRSPRELNAKISELQGSPSRRRELRIRGQKRALEDHSVARSLGSIKEKLGLK